MADVVQCPNCKQMVTKDSVFCIFCGTKIPAVPETTVSSPGVTAIRRCKNGHEFDDAGLVYCPVCGIPFEDSAAPEAPAETPGATWKCSCGHENSTECGFCTECGRPRSESKETGRIKAAEHKFETGVIPEGMYTPTADDLKPKHGRKA